MRSRAEQIAKATHGERSNRFAIKGREQESIVVFIGKDAEMVLPEIDHYLVELSLAVNSAQEFCALQLTHDHLRIFRRWSRLGRLWQRHCGSFFLHLACHCRHDGVDLLNLTQRILGHFLIWSTHRLRTFRRQW